MLAHTPTACKCHSDFRQSHESNSRIFGCRPQSLTKLQWRYFRCGDLSSALKCCKQGQEQDAPLEVPSPSQALTGRRIGHTKHPRVPWDQDTSEWRVQALLALDVSGLS